MATVAIAAAALIVFCIRSRKAKIRRDRKEYLSSLDTSKETEKEKRERIRRFNQQRFGQQS